jgi:DNA-binding SARP family transcriptional activator
LFLEPNRITVCHAVAAVEVDYAVLGPLEAHAEGKPVSLGGRVSRALLGALLLRANEVVSIDRLVEVVWGESPPPTASHAIHVYVSKLRKALGAESIGHTTSGYVLRVAPGRIDLERFEQLSWTARQELAAGDAARACELFDEALSLWRGPALADLELEDFAQSSIARLDELKLAAMGTRFEAMLALGRHSEIIPELDALTADHPHDERLCGLLMLALYRSGRQSDALSRYQSARRCLSEDLGIEPSQSLRDLESRMLSHDVALELEPGGDEPIRSVVVLPQRLDQLEELATLTEPFGRSRNPHEVILAWLERPGPAETVSTQLAEASAILARLRAGLVDRGARARVAAFTAADPAEDALRLARRPEVDLLVLGRDLSDLEDGRFDAELARVVALAPCDVALWVRPRDRPLPEPEGPILVPFGALEHDWAALELAAWLASTTKTLLVLLGSAGDSHGERRDASRMLADAGLLIQRAAGVVTEPRLMEPGRSGLVDATSDASLVLAGLSDRWPSEGLGETRLELVKSGGVPVMFLRRGQRPGGLSPPEGLTLYRWSVTVAA